MTNHHITYNQTVKEALALALFHLLKTKTITQISISDITHTAGVSRSSFYRNFDTKEQVLCDYIQTLYRNYFQNIQLSNRKDTSTLIQFLTYRFQFIYTYKDYFILLRKHNLLYYLFETLDPDLSNMLSGISFTSKYDQIFFSSCSAGIIQQWIDNHFEESVEDMVQILTHITVNLRKGTIQ